MNPTLGKQAIADHPVDQVADFNTWCRHEFSVVPELLLNATDHL